MSLYALRIVDTHTPPGWLIFVNAVRILLTIYAAYRYIGISKKIEDDTRKIEGETKNRIKWFSLGVIFFIFGIIINLTGGIFSLIVIEILALIIIDIGALIVLKGFLI